MIQCTEDSIGEQLIHTDWSAVAVLTFAQRHSPVPTNWKAGALFSLHLLVCVRTGM